MRALEVAKLELGARLAEVKQLTESPPDPSPSKSESGALLKRDPNEAPCPTLLEFLSVGGRYANHQMRKQTMTTRRREQNPIRYLLASDLATLRLDEIRTADINSYTTWRMEGGRVTFAKSKHGKTIAARKGRVHSATINKSLRVLLTALRFAYREQLIPSVPYIEMLPETDAKSRRGPSREDFQKLLGTAETMRVSAGPRDPAAPWLPEVLQLISEFGFRPGELFNLTWTSVKFDHGGDGKLRGAVYVEEQKRSGHVPKNGKRRLIPMTDLGREVLLKLKNRQPRPKDDDLVVPNIDGMPYIKLDTATQKGGGTSVWKRLSKRSGVHVSMYSLRHYYAEQTLNAGVPLHLASRWMGHSKVEMTSKRYGDFAPDNADQWKWAAARSQMAAAAT